VGGVTLSWSLTGESLSMPGTFISQAETGTDLWSIPDVVHRATKAIMTGCEVRL